MTNRIGYNINGSDFSKAQVLDFCSSGATSYLIRNNVGLAQEVAIATKAIIVSREDWPDDEADFPPRILTEWETLAAKYPDVYHYWPNEPNPADVGDFLAKGAQFIRDCVKQGIRFCFGNFATAKIVQPADVENGLWDTFLRAACECAVDGKGYIGFHDYMSVVLPFGCAAQTMPIEQMYTRALGQGWPTYREIVQQAEVNYHLFRWVPLMLRAEKLGYDKGFDILLTECFWDRMGDLDAQGVLAKADSLQGGKVRGLPATMKALDAMYPNFPPGHAALSMLAWCEETHPGHVKGFHLFTLDTEDKWADFDLSGMTDFLGAISRI